MNPIKDPLPELELAMARAEKLNYLWSNEEALCSTRPRSYCSQNQELRFPLTVMGDFIIYSFLSGFTYSYQWVSRRDATGKKVIFGYPAPDDLADGLCHMDHATGTFYLAFRLRTAQEPLQVVDIKLDVLDGQPWVANYSQIMLKEGHKIEYMASSKNNHFVYFKLFDPFFGDQFHLDILDLRTKSVSEVRLLHPLSFPRYPGLIHVSDTFILSVADREKFAIFKRSDSKDEMNPTQESPPLLQVAFSGTYPSRFRDSGYLLPVSSPVIVGAAASDAESPSKIHLLFTGDFGIKGQVKDECIEIMGSTRGFALSIPPSTQTCYTLGITSTTEFKRSNASGEIEKEANYFYAIRLDGIGPSQDVNLQHLKAIRMDLSAWVNDDDKYTHVIDFNPFSGTALLAGQSTHLDGPSSQSIIVLDYLCTE